MSTQIAAAQIAQITEQVASACCLKLVEGSVKIEDSNGTFRAYFQEGGIKGTVAGKFRLTNKGTYRRGSIEIDVVAGKVQVVPFEAPAAPAGGFTVIVREGRRPSFTCQAKTIEEAILAARQGFHTFTNDFPGQLALWVDTNKSVPVIKQQMEYGPYGGAYFNEDLIYPGVIVEIIPNI